MVVEQRERTRIMTITPATAVIMLEGNDHNRTLRNSVVKHYARQMKAGLWQLNGETIKIASDGRLLDGQHRLQAVIEAGVAIDSYVIEGLEADAFQTIDTGARRTPADVLTIRGEQNTNKLSGACSWIWRYERGIHNRGGPPKPTSAEIEDVLERHPGIRESLNLSKKLARLIAPSLAAFMHYLFSEKDVALTEEFFEGLVTGANLDSADPVYRLRERLMLNRQAKSHLQQIDVMALMIKAWNSKRSGKRIRQLGWRSEGPRAEEFPEIQ